MDDKEILRIKKRAEAELLNIPGVHSVGIGAKEVDGKPTGEICIKVYVIKKKPLPEIPVEEQIPPEIEGVSTDIYEAPMPEISQVQGTRPPFTEDKERYRPLRGGIRIGREGRGFGTLGCFFTVQGNPNIILGATNHHVLYDDCSDTPDNEAVGQPKFDESCFGCCTSVIGRVVRSVCDIDLDFSLIQLSGGLEWFAEIQQMGFVTGGFFVTQGDATSLSYQVSKRGQKTGLTGGVLEAVEVSGTINKNDGTVHRTFDHAIRIRPNPDTAGAGTVFSSSGDSGSAIVNDDGQVIGILFGGAGTSGSFAIPLDLIISKFATMPAGQSLNLSVATATTNNDTRVVPFTETETEAFNTTTPQPALGVAPELEQDLVSSPLGNWYIDLYLKHTREVRELINHNQRVATVWHRSGAAELFQSLINVARNPKARVPDQIRDRSIDEVLTDMSRILLKYGSLDLQMDLETAKQSLPNVEGLTYVEILERLKQAELLYES